MPIISNDEERLNAAIESAESAFWADIVTSYPEATSGDLSPAEAIGLEMVMRRALTEWLMFNCDTPPEEPWRTTEILLHRIEYNYHKDMELTESDEEHIAYSISQGISEGELNAEVPDVLPTEMVRGYWKINNKPT